MTARQKYRRKTSRNVWSDPETDWSIRARRRWHRIAWERKPPRWINGRLTKCRKARPEWLS